MTFAHVGGLPLEETLGLFGPALVLVAGAASARLGARLRRIGRRPRARNHQERSRRTPMTVHGTIVPVAGCALAALALTPAAAGAAAGELDPRRSRAAADDKRVAVVIEPDSNVIDPLAAALCPLVPRRVLCGGGSRGPPT